MMASIWLVVSLLMLFVAQQREATAQRTTNIKQMVESVNSLLTGRLKLEKDDLEESHLISPLQRAQMEAIEREIHAMLEGTSTSMPTPLADNMRHFLANLDSHGCDQVSLDALLIIGNVEPKASPPLVQTYARLKVDLCWQQFVASFPARLNKLMSKLPESTFQALEQVSATVAEIRSGDRGPPRSATATHRPPSAIKIDDNPKEEEEKPSTGSGATSGGDSITQLGLQLEAIEALETSEQRREFALALNRLYGARRRLELEQFGSGGELNQRVDARRFFERHYLRPCEQLIERLRGLASEGNIFKVHLRQTLGQALAYERRQNARLNYELQVYRVCRLMVGQADGVVEMLVGMRN